MASNLPDKNESKEFYYKTGKAVVATIAKEGTKFFADRAIEAKYPNLKGGGALAGAGIGLAIEIVSLCYEYKARCDRIAEYEKTNRIPERTQECTRRLESAQESQMANINLGIFPHLKIKDRLNPAYFDDGDSEIIALENSKLNGRDGTYFYKDTPPDLEAVLPEGEENSNLLKIKIVKHTLGCSKCIWVKGITIKIPCGLESELQIEQIQNDQVKEPQTQYYADITLYKYTPEGPEKHGVVRLRTEGGLIITQNNKLLHKITTRTEHEDRYDIEEAAIKSHRENRLSQTRQLRGKYMLEGHDLTCSLASLSFQDQKVIRTGQYMFDEQQSWKEFEKIKSIQARFAYDVKALAEKIAEINKAVEELKYECSKPRMSKIRALLHDLTVCIRSKPSKKTCSSEIRVAVDKLEDHGKEIGQLLNTARSKALDEIDNIGYKLQVLFEDTIKRTDSPQDIETIMNLRSKFQQSVNEFTGIEAELMDLSGSIDRVANDNKVPIKMKLGGVSEVRGDKKQR